MNEAALDGDGDSDGGDGKVSDALRLYQHALELDDSIGDQTASAADWLAYGKFLDRAGFPVRMVYACYVKAQAFSNSALDAPQRQLLEAASRDAAKRTGSEAARIRRDPQPILQEALALRR